MSKIKLSIIVTTYNWPEALKLVLSALAEQVSSTMEVIIADDGSGVDTKIVIDEAKKKMNCLVTHVWQPDHGFEAAKIRNKAIAQSVGEYIIFIDGDCIMTKNFIQNHLTLKTQNHFVSGNRVLLTRKFTQEIMDINTNTKIDLSQWGFFAWLMAKWQNKINRFSPCLQSRTLNTIINFYVKQTKKTWQGVKTCNLAVWKKDLISINGFDENFIGWGYEDSDLVVRLLNNGVKRKEGRFYAPVIHLWHEEYARDKAEGNFQKLEQVLLSSLFFSQKGLNQYARK